MIGVGSCIYRGCTIVLRRKFSVRNFTPDCIKYKCNIIQYIGELCRYLLNNPENPNEESQLSIDYAFGNGMLSDIWLKFQHRYHINHVVEFYGATEGTWLFVIICIICFYIFVYIICVVYMHDVCYVGNCNLFNGCDVVGCCGFIPRILDFLYPLRLV